MAACIRFPGPTYSPRPRAVPPSCANHPVIPNRSRYARPTVWAGTCHSGRWHSLDGHWFPINPNFTEAEALLQLEDSSATIVLASVAHRGASLVDRALADSHRRDPFAHCGSMERDLNRPEVTTETVDPAGRVPRSGTKRSEAELDSNSAHKLADSNRPTRWYSVDSLPTTASEKPQKFKIIESLATNR